MGQPYLPAARAHLQANRVPVREWERVSTILNSQVERLSRHIQKGVRSLVGVPDQRHSLQLWVTSGYRMEADPQKHGNRTWPDAPEPDEGSAPRPSKPELPLCPLPLSKPVLASSTQAKRSLKTPDQGAPG